MKKVRLVFSYVLLVIAFAACKPSTTKDADGKEKLNVSENEAGDIIGYTNDVIDVLKKYNEAAKQAVEQYDRSIDMMNGKGVGIYMGPKLNFLWTEKKKAEHAFGTPVSALGANRQFFADSLKKYKSLFDTFRGQDSVIDLYIKGKDYLDDKGVKGKDLMDKQFVIYDQLVVLRDAIGEKIESVGDAAEEIALKNDPMKDAYVAAKSDLKLAKNLLHSIGDAEKFSDADIAKIDSSYNGLTASIETHKKIDRAALTKGNKNDAYNRFYTELTEELTELKVVLRNLKQSKKLSESDYNTVNNIFTSIVSDYNSWVN